ELDRGQRSLRVLRGLGGDGGDRLADVPDLAAGEERLVLDDPAGPVRAVVSGDDRADARQRRRARRVEPGDAARGDGRAEDLRVEQPRSGQVDRVAGGTPDLREPVRAPDARADRSHGPLPAAASAASTIFA